MSTPFHILSITLDDFKTLVKAHKVPAFRAEQAWKWVYEKGVMNLDEMTNLGKKEREALPECASFALPEIVSEQRSSDGTVKWLFKLVDGHEIESVFIPEKKYGTLCVSSQVGCTLHCRFCHTGTQGLSRNLEAHEIVAQVWLAKKRLNEWEREDSNRRIVNNLVFMGMGEPLFNWENVSKACKTLMLENGFGFGSRRITISTSGMVENIGKIAEQLGTHLAISIHAPDNETRSKIMPINKKWPIEVLMAEIRKFPLKERRRITWEYVMLDGVNDSVEHANNLVKLIKGIPSFVNIIPFNEWPGSPFKCSKPEAIRKFEGVIKRAGVDVAVRATRGEDILAACGQLRGETSKFNTISTEFPTVVEKYGNEKQKLKVKIEDN